MGHPGEQAQFQGLRWCCIFKRDEEGEQGCPSNPGKTGGREKPCQQESGKDGKELFLMSLIFAYFRHKEWMMIRKATLWEEASVG